MEYENPLVGRLYDPVMFLPERLFLSSHREYLVSHLSGTVLDLGAGTGAMFPYFEAADTTDRTSGGLTVHALEPDPHMREQAKRRARDVTVDITIHSARAEDLPYAENSFDAVIASLVFCTIPDVDAALEEVVRVLKPGGEFRFLEHVRGSGFVGTVHDTVAPVWHCVAGGCTLNQHTGRRFHAHERLQLHEYERFETGLTRLVPLIRGRFIRRYPPGRDSLKTYR